MHNATGCSGYPRADLLNTYHRENGDGSEGDRHVGDDSKGSASSART